MRKAAIKSCTPFQRTGYHSHMTKCSEEPDGHRVAHRGRKHEGGSEEEVDATTELIQRHWRERPLRPRRSINMAVIRGLYTGYIHSMLDPPYFAAGVLYPNPPSCRLVVLVHHVQSSYRAGVLPASTLQLPHHLRPQHVLDMRLHPTRV